MKNKNHNHTSFSRILENVFILALVTFLLGTAAIYSSKITFGNSGEETNTRCAKKKILQSLHQSFVRPYASAWKKIAPRTTAWANGLMSLKPTAIGIHIPPAPRFLSSMAYHLMAFSRP